MELSKTLTTIKDGPTAWKCLNGLFCVYKPLGKSIQAVRNAIRSKLCQSLNELEPRPVSKFVSIEGPMDSLDVIVRPDYSDHPFVVGPRYQMEDINLSWATSLGSKTSGVLVMGINNGTKMAMKFNESRLLRSYLVKGEFGHATDNMFADGKILERASFKHVKKSHLDKVLAVFQAMHQKQMFMQSGVDIQSETAYELATKGMLRPSDKNVPLVYNFKTVDFDPPNFTIEVDSINEYEDYLIKLIHDIGARLRTLAVCTHIRCVRHGPLTVEHSLLRKHWTTEHVINNMALCRQIMEQADVNLQHQPFLKTISQS